MTSLVELETAAVEICRGAGDIVMRYHREGGATVSHKGDIDLVTTADHESEAFILKEVARRFPGHAVLAEESGAMGDASEFRWLIDPVDGTTNFAHGLPHFAVLVAVQQRRHAGHYETVIGATLDPARNELFLARRGGGATLNGKPIRTSRVTRLIDALGATGFSYDRLFREADDNHREFCRLNLTSQGVRRFGAAGLDLAYVACGRLDFFWEYRLNPWDLAGGVLLVEEAGGQVSGLQGGGIDWQRGDVLVSNGPLHAPVLAALASATGKVAGSRQGIGVHLPAEVASRLQAPNHRKPSASGRGRKRRSPSGRSRAKRQPGARTRR